MLTTLLAQTSASGSITGVAGWMTGLIDSLGAVGVGVITVTETVFPPIPSEVVLPAAGYLAGLGQLGFWSERDVERAWATFERWDQKAIFWERLVPGVRSLVSIPAGAKQMAVGRFVALTAAGSLVWNAALMSAGWFLVSKLRHRNEDGIAGEQDAGLVPAQLSPSHRQQQRTDEQRNHRDVRSSDRRRIGDRQRRDDRTGTEAHRDVVRK